MPMKPSRVAKRRWQWPLTLGMVVLWIMLWGNVAPVTVLGGLALVLLVQRVFFLPPAEQTGRFNALWAIAFAARLLVDIFAASLKVAGQALRFGYRPVNAIIEIDLHTTSDLILTLTAESISLVPGSIVLEADRAQHKLYLHTLGTPDEAALERARAQALATERRITLAFGSRDDVNRLLREMRREREQHTQRRASLRASRRDAEGRKRP